MKVLLNRRAAFLACAAMAVAAPLWPAMAQEEAIVTAAWPEQCSVLTATNFDQCCPNGKVENLYGSAADDACTNAQAQGIRRRAVQPAPVAQPLPGTPVANPPAGPVAEPPGPVAGAPNPGTPEEDDDLANPGNDKDVGRAGESPNDSDFGGGSNGKSDAGDKGSSGAGGNGSKGGNGNNGGGGSKGNGNGGRK